MSDELLDPRFEHELRSVLQRLAPAETPGSIKSFIAAVPERERRARPATPRLVRFAAFASATAVVVLAIVWLAVFSGNRPTTGPIGRPTFTSEPSASVSSEGPAASPAVTVSFRIDSNGHPLTAAELQQTSDVIYARYALLAPTATRDDVQVTIDGTGTLKVTLYVLPTFPTDSSWLVGVLKTRGEIEFVPIASFTAVPGATIDPAAIPLFSGSAVDSVTLGYDHNDQRTLEIQVNPEAAQALATWSTANVGATLALTVDGHVELAPVIRAPISGGDMSITVAVPGLGPDLNEAEYLQAFLISGPLPYRLEILVPPFPTASP